MTAGPLPGGRIQLDEARTVCFVGDVRLGDGGRNDGFRAKDDLLVDFRRERVERGEERCDG